MGGRAWDSSVWCVYWQRCHGVGVPGYRGGGEVELCYECERERLARTGEILREGVGDGRDGTATTDGGAA